MHRQQQWPFISGKSGVQYLGRTQEREIYARQALILHGKDEKTHVLKATLVKYRKSIRHAFSRGKR
jgi:hypothetical protein